MGQIIKGVLLDIDGTLVMSNDAHAESWVEAFAVHGLEVKYEQVRPLIGMGGDKLLPRLDPILNNEEGLGKEISDTRTKLFLEQYVQKLQPTPGARELVKKIQDAGLKTVVASSAKEDELEVLLKSAQVDDLLTKATTSSDVEKSKPDPDIVKAALSKIGLQAEQALMLGDTPYDIEAASRSGVVVIAVRCGGFSDQQLVGALAIYDDPADLLEHWNESPLAKVN